MKLIPPLQILARRVAPHTGAWIETRYQGQADRISAVAPHTGAWIETKSLCCPWSGSGGRPPHGGVD